MKEVLYNVWHLLYVNHIIFTDNVWTIFGHNPTSDIFWTEIYWTTRTSDGLGHIFFLKLAPLVDTHPKPCSWNIQFVCEHSNVRIVCEYLTIFAKNILFAKAADKPHLLAVLTKNYDPRNLRKDSENCLQNSSIIQLNVLVFALITSRNELKVPRNTLLNWDHIQN